jgi:uncharacterized delta-60 repeat protein
MARRVNSALLVLLVSTLILLTSAPHALAAAGDLDPTFSGNGKVRTGFSSTDLGAAGGALAVQSDGKIVDAGQVTTADSTPYLGLVRYNTDGTLDTTFGVGGKVETSLLLFAHSVDVAIQGDGKIVAVSQSSIARFTPDGSLDTSFGNSGLQTYGGIATAVAIQGDGKIVVAGWTPVTDTRPRSVLLVRYNPDGSRDAGFGRNGVAPRPWSHIGSQADDVAIQPTGDILVAGTGYFIVGPFGLNRPSFVLVRYKPNGSLDNSFSGNGKVRINFGAKGPDLAFGLAIQDDGKIVEVGQERKIGQPSNFGIARVMPGGSLDPTFSGDGKVRIDFSGNADAATSVAIQTNGKITVAGYAERAGGGASARDFGLTRLRVDGTLDPGFGGDGKVMTKIGAAAVGRDVAIEDGKMVVAGTAWSNPFPNAPYDFAAARYLSS